MEQKERFIVSARKYRPATWEQVVGQEAITETLHNAIEQGQLAHSYLFCGPRGVGKTTCARIFAKEINKASTESDDHDFSFNIFELDAASNNSVDDIRYLNEQVRIPPQVGEYKVYIIDEVHMLSKAAFNAFLKTLEEPPKHAKFILATTEKHKIIPTILSRCQIYDFNRITVDSIVGHLKNIAANENITYEEEALHVIGQKADGALRDALSIFDQLSSFTNRNLTYDAVLKNLHVLDYDYFFVLTKSLFEKDYAQALVTLDNILKQGFDGSHFLSGLETHLRDLLVCKSPATINLLEVGESVKVRYGEQANEIDTNWLIEALQTASSVESKYKNSLNQRLTLEVLLLNLASLDEKKKSSNQVSQKVKEPSTDQRLKPSTDTKQESPVSTARPESTSKAPEAVAKETVSTPSNVETRESLPTTEPEVSRQRRSRRAKTVSLNIDNVDLNAQTKGDSDEVEERLDISNSPQLPLTEAWNHLCEGIQNEGNSNLFAILKRQDISNPNATEVKVTLQHEIEEQEFTQHKTKVLTRLRNLTGNTSLSMTSKTELVQTDVKLFTAKDKFEELLKINPALKKFKKDLDLDISF